ncbi:hypothetical protein PRZ48_006570 [Zasmidium cellare]|uniref:Polyketide synthase n=1 Tax=Zasmidium cellare TaxID=395010 RepID=A0ABR0EPX6_ZASCE|nr:hypothetical protein PRZ48_006570 [Zasmidium cellare]
MDTFLRGRSQDMPLAVGSVKGNLGHTEPTAGLAGLLKAILILEKGLIPPTPTHKSLSPDVADVLGDSRAQVQIPTKNCPWPDGVVRRISVNTTGYGGTDAHVVIEHLDETLPRTTNAPRDVVVGNHPRVFVISHNRAEALKETAQGLHRFLSQRWAPKRENLLRDLAFTLFRRSQLDYRISFTGSTLPEVLEKLDSIAKGVNRVEATGLPPAICFAFTGQGAQWPQMGLDLMSHYPIFAESMRRSEAEFLTLGAGWRLIEELNKTKAESSINQAWLSQPCCTAIQIAIVDLLATWGLQPQAVCGHSSGEIAAAYAAGILTANEALKVAYFRGFHVEALRKSRPDLKGAMLAVGISAEDALDFIESGENVAVACYNSPQSATLSGDAEDVLRVKARLDDKGIFARKLDVDVAYHSVHMKLVETSYHEALDIQPKSSKDGICLYSSVTEELLDGTDMGPSYWTQNLISPVRFSQALTKLLKLRDSWITPGASGTTLVTEIGPHAALKGPITQIVKAAAVGGSTIYQNSLKRGEHGPTNLLELSGQAHERGAAVCFSRINEADVAAPTPQLLSGLPKYLWNREKSHWAESRRSAAYRHRLMPKHDILGSPTMDSIDSEPSWRVHLRMSSIPWVTGHVLQQQVVLPGATYLSMIVEALKVQYMNQKRRWKDLAIHFRDVEFVRVLLVPDTEAGVETITSLRLLSSSSADSPAPWYEFRVFTLTAEGGSSTEHCRGMVSVASSQVAGMSSTPHEPQVLCELSPAGLYSELESLGAKYTGYASQLKAIRGGRGFAECEFEIPNTREGMPEETEQPCVVHPLTLEAVFQTPFAALKLNNQLETIYLLQGIDELYISTDIPAQPGTVLTTETEVETFGILKTKAGVTVAGPRPTSDSAYIRATGIRYAGLEQEDDVPEGLEEESLCHYIDWVIDPLFSSSDALEKWIRRTVPERAAAATKMNSIIEHYCCAAIKHMSMSSSAYAAKNKIILGRLLRRKESSDLDMITDINLAMEEELLAQGSPGKMVLEAITVLSQHFNGQGGTPLPLTRTRSIYQSLQEDAAVKQSLRHVASYLKILRLKRPSLRILALGNELEILRSIVNDVLSSSSAGEDLKDDDCKCTYAEVTTGDHEDPPEAFQLDLTRALEDQNIEQGQFDVVLIPSFLSHLAPNLSAVLPRLRSCLRDEGAMISIDVTNPTIKWEVLSASLSTHDHEFVNSKFVDATQWEATMYQSGFKDLTAIPDVESSNDHETSVLIARTSRETSLTNSPVTIIVPEGFDDVVQPLVSKMQANNASVSISTVEQAVAHSGSFIILLDLSKPFLKDQTSTEWQKLQEIMTNAGHVLWVSKRGASEDSVSAMGMITGFARSLRVEFPELQLATLDIEFASPSEVVQSIHNIHSTHLKSDVSAGKRTEREWEFAQRGDAVLVQRVFSHSATSGYIEDCTSPYHPRPTPVGTENRSLGLRIRTAGMLDSLYWADMEAHSKPVGPEDIRVAMQSFSINTLDFSTITGESTRGSNLLTEGVGVIASVGSQVKDLSVGDTVYAFEPTGLAIDSILGARKVIKIPQGIAIEAVTAPLAYGTALFSLRNIAHLQPTETVLIHCAATSVGQAAIAIAKYVGAGDILVTANTTDERELLKKQWSISPANIFLTADLETAPEVVRRTHARGVDILLNCAPTPALGEVCSILAVFGRLVDVGLQDTRRTARLETKLLAKNASYTAVDMTLLAEARPELLREVFASTFALVTDSKVQRLSKIETYPLFEAKEAFQSSHPGQKVLEVGADMRLMIQPSRPVQARLRHDASYLVVGGTGGIGRVITRYLVQLGAARIITLSPSGNDKAETRQLVKELFRRGITLENVKGTAADIETLKTIARDSSARPVRGVIHAGAVFEDGPFEKTSYEQWKRGTEVKIEGTINLHEVFGTSVDFFTMLSSVVGVQGTYGQIAYNTGNSFQDAFARTCAARGLPARSLDLSMVAGEGQGAQADAVAFLQRHGLRQIDLKTVTAAIGFTINHPIAPTAAEGQILVGFRQEHPDSGSKIAALQRPDSRFSHIWFQPIGSSSSAVKSGEFDVQTSLREAATAEEAAQAAFNGLRGLVSQLLDVESASVLPERSVISYGLDSLTSMELRKYVQTTLASAVQMLEIMNPMPLMELAKLVAGRSALVNSDLFPAKE